MSEPTYWRDMEERDRTIAAAERANREQAAREKAESQRATVAAFLRDAFVERSLRPSEASGVLTGNARKWLYDFAQRWPSVGSER